jgi:hypothetical protein
VVEEDGFIWRLTGFYGEPHSDKEELSWRALRVLKVARRRPWLYLGDFSEILMSHEKEGGLPRSQACMNKFREVLEDCLLDDLGYSGDTFTWRNNSHDSSQYIRERLDRAVADVEWRTRFPSVRVRNGQPQHSNYQPVIVTTEDEVAMRQKEGGRPFRFEAGWVKEEDCEVIVRNAWNLSMDVQSGKVTGAIKDVVADLWDWSRIILGDLEKRINL